jgi:hypothetical protein
MTIIKAEYLLTVSVADVLATASLTGGIDADIELEARTWHVSYRSLVSHLPMPEWFRLRRLVRLRDKAQKRAAKWPNDMTAQADLVQTTNALAAEPLICVERTGKVDVFVAVQNGAASEQYVAELKGFDPSAVHVNLDVVRMKEFLLLNGGTNNLKTTYLVYPALRERTVKTLYGVAAAVLDPAGLKWTIHTRPESTDTLPEEGVAGYTALCLEASRRG